MMPESVFSPYATQDELDAAYRVAPDLMALGAARARAQSLSTAARGKLAHVLGVPYGPTVDEYLDIFPAGEGSPVFIFFHGGYWRALSSGDYSFVAGGPVANGITVVSVNYALAPGVGLPEIIRQARAAIAWTVRNIGQHGGDAARISVGGHSAGAHLAAMGVLADWEGRYGIPQPCKSVIFVSGVFDLAPLRYSFLQPQLQLDSQTVMTCSPIRIAQAMEIPAYFAVGANESSAFHRQTKDFMAAWRDPQIDLELETVVDADHFQALEPTLDPDSAMCRWLKERSR